MCVLTQHLILWWSGPCTKPGEAEPEVGDELLQEEQEGDGCAELHHNISLMTVHFDRCGGRRRGG
jgi:hypothetical protein